MKKYFGDKVLINNKVGYKLYNHIRTFPIIDYHCHLNEENIAKNNTFSNITELWLKHDHYKWRVMRSCGIEEKYITGDASDYEKFLAFAKVMPKIIGNPVYYWAQLELKYIFCIDKPLNENNAKEIYDTANSKLKSINTRDLLNMFKVDYICTTDDPISKLEYHGKYENIVVAPTFRPDRIFKLEEEYIEELSLTSGIKIVDLKSLKKALENRLDYFISKGCKISDHGMDYLPAIDYDEEEVNEIFIHRETLNSEQKYMFFSHMMHYLAKLYKSKNIVMQIHFATFRNINTSKHTKIGADAGYDVIRHETNTDNLAQFLNDLESNNNLPKTIIYCLNDNAIKEIAVIAGSFENVKLGPSWWFNDTKLGNKQHLETIAEYSTLGTFLGMLTDSRSFSSYVRFDFFRRILANLLGEYVENGEYQYNDAIKVIEDICYYNIKEFLGI